MRTKDTQRHPQQQVSGNARAKSFRADPLEDFIRGLGQARKLRQQLIGKEDGEGVSSAETEYLVQEALALVHIYLREAQRWGEYYERRRKGMPARAEQRRLLAATTKNGAARLDTFARNYSSRLRATIEPLAPITHLLSRTSITDTLKSIETLRARLSELARELAKPLPGVKGRPSNDWAVGFVWGMAIAWRELTTARISPRGLFPQFLQLAYDSISATEDVEDTDDAWAPEWETLIKTAIKRFHVRRKDWLRPGDDLSQFGGEKSVNI